MDAFRKRWSSTTVKRFIFAFLIVSALILPSAAAVDVATITSGDSQAAAVILKTPTTTTSAINVSNLTDYIRKDGTTTTTASIPFAEGLSIGAGKILNAGSATGLFSLLNASSSLTTPDIRIINGVGAIVAQMTATAIITTFGFSNNFAFRPLANDLVIGLNSLSPIPYNVSTYIGYGKPPYYALYSEGYNGSIGINTSTPLDGYLDVNRPSIFRSYVLTNGNVVMNGSNGFNVTWDKGNGNVIINANGSLVYPYALNVQCLSEQQCYLGIFDIGGTANGTFFGAESGTIFALYNQQGVSATTGNYPTRFYGGYGMPLLFSLDRLGGSTLNTNLTLGTTGSNFIFLRGSNHWVASPSNGVAQLNGNTRVELATGGTVRMNQTSTLTYTTTNFVSAGNITGDLGNIKYPYASYSSNKTQTMISTTAAQLVNYTHNESQYLISRNLTTITVSQAGTYLITYSAIVDCVAAGRHVDIWLRVNGTDIARSNTRHNLPISGESVMTVNYVQPLNANDNFELVWNADNTACQLLAVPAATSPTRPESPAIILTVNKISR